MSKTILSEHNVLVFLLFHIKRLRADAGAPQIVTADTGIWQRAVLALRQHCNSTLLHVFTFRRVGLVQLSKNLEETLRNLSATDAVTIVPTAYENWHTNDFILKDDLTNLVHLTRVESTNNTFGCYNTLTSDPNITEDTQTMFNETRELAAQLLPLLDERVDLEVRRHKKEIKTK